jgi:hypothetical protein
MSASGMFDLNKTCARVIVLRLELSCESGMNSFQWADALDPRKVATCVPVTVHCDFRSGQQNSP